MTKCIKCHIRTAIIHCINKKGKLEILCEICAHPDEWCEPALAAKKKCTVCGNEFETYQRHYHHLCSDKCRKTHNKNQIQARPPPPKRPCLVCNNMFRPKTTQGGAKMCSTKCKTKRQLFSNRKNYKKRSPLTRICRICEKEFTIEKVSSNNQRMCSVECKAEAKKQRTNAYQRKAYHHKKGLIKKK